MDETEAGVARAWELSYLAPDQTAVIGRRIAAAGGPQAAEGWLLTALAEARVGQAEAAASALQHARAGHAAQGHARGLAMCDEVEAILLRRVGELERSASLLQQLDARDDYERDAMHSFIGHTTRAINAKLRGQHDEAVRHFCAAQDSAERTGWAGPRLTALSNLGAYHQILHNLDDARSLTEAALAMARELKVQQVVTTAATNLVIIHHAAGEFPQARSMVDFLLGHVEELIPDALLRYASTLAVGHLAVGEIDAAMQWLDRCNSTAITDNDSLLQRTWVRARCLLARGDAGAARELAEDVLGRQADPLLTAHPYDMMTLHWALAEACEAQGDLAGALRRERQARALYVHLVGRSARARYVALQVGHELTQSRHERDLAEQAQRAAEADRERLRLLNAALQAQIAQTDSLHAQLREQALRDPLTGLHNRRHLSELAPALLEMAGRRNIPVAIVLIDLDHFKHLNDAWGHHAGDIVLRDFSSLLQQALRRGDLVCRYGGEEFVAVMPETDANGAQAVIARLLANYQEQQSRIANRDLPRGSFSAGIALFPHQGHTLEQLLSLADRALYKAKDQGRARIELAALTTQPS